MSKHKWKKFKGYQIETKQILPGVWRLRERGYLIRGRVKSEKTGKLEQVCRSVDTADPHEALRILSQELEKRKSGTADQPSRMRFCDWAVSAYEERVVTGEIRSASTRRSWDGILRDHLLRPYPEGFGDVWLDGITVADVMTWRKRCAQLVSKPVSCLACARKGIKVRAARNRRCAACAGTGTRRYGPRTINQWFAKFQTIMAMAKARKLIPEDPAENLAPLPTDLAVTYTEEQPNALEPGEEAVQFLDAMWTRYPRWYAMTVLGMAIGLRPSHMRPLRRKGPTPDLVLLPEGTALLYVRRSHSEGKEIMEKTKTSLRQRINLPAWLVQVLKWHIDRLPEGPERESDLLFPAQHGGLLDECCLYHPFQLVTKAAGIQKHLSPRALRRTYQDLQRAAKTPDVVTRSISGHVTEEMQLHYSTVQGSEQVAALDRVGKLLRFPVQSGTSSGTLEEAGPSGTAAPEQSDPSKSAQLAGFGKNGIKHGRQ